MKKKILSIGLAVMMLFGVVAIASNNYEAFKKAIDAAKEEGQTIIEGTMIEIPTNEFQPFMIGEIPTKECDLATSGQITSYEYLTGSAYSDYYYIPARIGSTTYGRMIMMLVGYEFSHQVNLQVIDKSNNTIVFNQTVNAIQNIDTTITLENLKYNGAYYIKATNPNPSTPISGGIFVD